ncbi:hypothetical protein [Trinickia sp. Y13]|uniref:hypothetical protein n=1 Tax=Trinickia sp. Y13 TaxID=2917807 RepID=UPI0024052EBB|nr:hypothetical protein [Trinickia sp. Y13]MDG0024892.1 hypothetical protein [Trinickia sp. Y13]
MSDPNGKQPAEKNHEEARIDHGVDETFPASDPPAVGGATRVDPGRSPKPGEGGSSEDGGGSDDTKDAGAKHGAVNPSADSDNGLAGIAG